MTLEDCQIDAIVQLTTLVDLIKSKIQADNEVTKIIDSTRDVYFSIIYQSYVEDAILDIKKTKKELTYEQLKNIHKDLVLIGAQDLLVVDQLHVKFTVGHIQRIMTSELSRLVDFLKIRSA